METPVIYTDGYDRFFTGELSDIEEYCTLINKFTPNLTKVELIQVTKVTKAKIAKLAELQEQLEKLQKEREAIVQRFNSLM